MDENQQAMTSPERRSRSRTGGLTWTLLIVAAPLVYLLSVPPFFAAMAPWVQSSSSSRTPPPSWMQAYAAPYVWVSKHTPLAYPLKKYTAFWSTLRK